jgi:hypothetical protein
MVFLNPQPSNSIMALPINLKTCVRLHRPWKRLTNCTKLLTILTLLATIMLIIYYYTQPSSEDSLYGPILELITWNATETPRITKATVLYTPSNNIFNHSLSLHEVHNKQLGYKQHILHTQIVKDFTNQLLWLHHLIVTELQKPNPRASRVSRLCAAMRFLHHVHVLRANFLNI